MTLFKYKVPSRPSAMSWSTGNFFNLLSRCQTLKQLHQIHAQLQTLGFIPHLQPLSCKVLNTYKKFGQPKSAHLLFLQIPNPDLVSITSMITLLVQVGRPRQAISMFYQMIFAGFRPDAFAIVGAISASGQSGDLGVGKASHGMVYRFELGGHETVVGNALIDMYCRNGKVKMARKVFEGMSERVPISWSSMLHGYMMCVGLDSARNFFDQIICKEVGCWTVMITGCVRLGLPLHALELFYCMRSDGHFPNIVTVVGVLSACADVGALDLGRLIHGHICKMEEGANLDIAVPNALIDMYTKSGQLDEGYAIFKVMMAKDLYTWTTMISGFAAHGDGKQAIECFLKMMNSGIIPNEITFVSVLLACSHSGLVKEGRQWFDIMCKQYNINPRIEHYGCMVDLLSRAGMLEEAHNLIRGMEIDPDSVIWRSLLSASLVHGNLELAQIAGKEILKLEPDDDGVYVLLWNLNARLSKWDEALEMRKIMKNRRVLKKPGCSWIEVNGVVTEFLVEDKSHPLQSDMDVVLDGIEKQLRRSSDVNFFHHHFFLKV